MRSRVATLFPALSHEKRKGHSGGRLAVVGGSQWYTGSPYHAAISSLKIGADVAAVFCAECAAIPIKSYSPELIVLPFLPCGAASPAQVREAADKVISWMPKLAALVIGPGLSRDENMLAGAAQIITAARQCGLALVLDGDALSLVAERPELIRGYRRVILTPNVTEFQSLWEASVEGGKKEAPRPPAALGELSLVHGLPLLPADQLDKSPTAKLAKALGGVTIIRKGAVDVISNGEQVVYCSTEGSPRRCGGQGDLLAGLVGTFAGWAMPREEEPKQLLDAQESCNLEEDGEGKTSGGDKTPRARQQQQQERIAPSLLAAWAACDLVRTCARTAYSRQQRGTVTADIVAELTPTINRIYPLQKDGTSAGIEDA